MATPPPALMSRSSSTRRERAGHVVASRGGEGRERDTDGGGMSGDGPRTTT
jgi:hypothetical protein